MKTYKDLFDKIEMSSRSIFNIYRELENNFSDSELIYIKEMLKTAWNILDILYMTDFAKKENLEKCLPLPDEDDELPF